MHWGARHPYRSWTTSLPQLDTKQTSRARSLSPLDQQLEMIAPAGTVYTVDAFGIAHVDSDSLQLDGSIWRQTGERRCLRSPQGCQDVGVDVGASRGAAVLGSHSSGMDTAGKVSAAGETCFTCP